MTEDQYKEGLLHLRDTIEELDMCETWDEVEHVVDYLNSIVNQALESIENKRVLN